MMPFNPDRLISEPTMATPEQRRPIPPNDPSLLERRLERALVLLAYLIELDGDVHVPMYERIEGELRTMQQRRNTRTRARQLLAGYANSTGDAVSWKPAMTDSEPVQLPYVRTP
ncbi:MAG: hypothetical protein KIS73_17735 [Enhydrobacter sp.]|nr:hypothetical protein [Enhydrobacter sp.]